MQPRTVTQPSASTCVGLRRNRRPSIFAGSAAALLSVSLLAGSAHAASASWLAAPVDGTWEPAVGPNWSTGGATFPGATSGSVNTDVATFNVVSTTTSIVINNAGFPVSLLNIGGITFTDSASNYTVGTIGGQGILLTSGGTIQIDGSLTATNALETVNAPLVISTGGTYTFANDSANGTGAGAGTLGFGGGITGVGGAVVLTLTGANTNLNGVNGIIGDGGGMLSITKTGAGTWALTGVNTYSGGTTISGGTLAISNDNNLGATTGGVTFNSNATLQTTAGVTFNAARTFTVNATGGTIDTNGQSSTINGPISGAGILSVIDSSIGGGKLTLTADNSGLTGGLAVGSPSGAPVTVAVSADKNLGAAAAPTSISNNGTVEMTASFSTARTFNFPVSIGNIKVDPGVTTTFTGSITGTGAIQKLGGGTLIITSNNPGYTGNTTVTGGLLQVDGSIASPNTFVNSGGTLGGIGFIGGNVINAGVVSPGDSPGTLTIKGNYTHAAGGVLRIEIGGRDITQHDLLSVGGTASLNGTLQLVRLDDFNLKRNESVTFLTAIGGVIGRFSMVVSDFASDTILQPTVVYGSNSVALEAVQGSFAALAGLTPNQQAVAQALDSAAGNRRANALFDYLDYRSLNKLPGDLDKIAPEELTSVFTLGVSLANVQSQNIQRRTDDIRSGSSGFSAQRFAMNGSAPSYSGSIAIATGVAGPSGEEGKAVKETRTVAPTEKRWGMFLSGTGEWVSVGDTANARGYDLESGGFTVGVDYKVTPNLAVGLAAGYTGTTADLVDRGRVWVNGGKLGLYATTFVGGWYADAAVFGGYNSYDTRRSALQGEARGDTEGGELNALFGTGYDFKAGGVTFGPTATFNYTYIGTNEFTEHGSLAPLNIHGGKGESLRTALGLKASYDWKVGGIVIKPELRAAWQHEYGDAAYALDASFANGAGNSFLVNGPELGRDSALLGAGFAVELNDRCAIYTYYDGELGRKNYQATNVTGGFRLTF